MKIQLLAVAILWVFGCIFSTAMAVEKEPLPPSVQRVLFKAQTMVGEKRYTDARRKLEDYRREKERSHYLIEFTLGDIGLLTAEYPQAAKDYRKALELKPDYTPALMNLGKALYEMRDYPAAADSFHQAYQTDAAPHAERLYYSATAYLMAAKPQQGLAMFEILLDKHPGDVKLEWKPTLVQLYLDLDRPQAARPVIEELATQSTGPERIRWQETLLGHYLLLDQKERALAYARELTRKAPTVPRWWKAQAHLLLERQAFEPALAAMTIYAKLIEPDESEKRLLADLNLQAGIPARAADYYQALVEAGAEAAIVTRLAHALRLSGRPAEALEQVDRFLENQQTPGLLWLKGELLYEMKAYLSAAATFRRCAADGHRVGQAWLMAGYASWLAKNVARAREEFTRAAAYPAQKKSALAALRELDPAVLN